MQLVMAATRIGQPTAPVTRTQTIGVRPHVYS